MRGLGVPRTRAELGVGAPSGVGENSVPFATATDGARIHYSTWGDKQAEPVTLVHGLGADKWGWVLQRMPFGAHYRCVALDNRGSGRSDKPEGDYDIVQMADDIIAVLDDAGVQSTHLVGASMGGVLAMVATIRHPERVRSLVLACTAGRLELWRRELFEQWIDIAENKGMRRYVTQNLNWLIGPSSWRRLWPLANFIGPIAVRAPAHGLVGQLRGMIDADEVLLDQLRDIGQPTLVVVGSEDILTPPHDSELLAERIPHARLVIIPKAAHGFMIEHAREFNREVLAFLSEQPSLRPAR